MTVKEKLKLLGVTAPQMKGLDDAALQGLLDDKTLELTSTGQPLPWVINSDPLPPTGDELPPTGDMLPPTGDPLPPSGDDLLGEGAPFSLAASELLKSGAMQPQLNQGGDQPGQDDDQLSPRLAGLELMTTKVTARFGFRGPAKDFCMVNGKPVERGEELDVLAGDELRLGELTYDWLDEQSLIIKG
ncbi:hypothetical protein [Aeromonas sobria]|uniref:hypothetical protein n=1 Tax=Aeromonas sobria TaxID=646 RepID=UPI0011E003DB|nr:hypothetical protein [Aeromonas sobria]